MLHTNIASEEQQKGESHYAFAYGSRIKDPMAKSKRVYDIQPFLMVSIIKDDDNALSESLIPNNLSLYDMDGTRSLMSLTDGYEKNYSSDFVFGDIWVGSYDFHGMLHKYNSSTKQLGFIHTEINDDAPNGSCWFRTAPNKIVISPEVVLEDNSNGERPSSASNFTDVFVSAKELGNKYFDYWNSFNTRFTMDRAQIPTKDALKIVNEN